MLKNRPFLTVLLFLFLGSSLIAQGQNTVVKQSTDIYIANEATNAVALKVIKPRDNSAPFLEFGTQTNTWFLVGSTGRVEVAALDIFGATGNGISGMRLSHNQVTGEGLLYDISNQQNIIRYSADDGSLTFGHGGVNITNNGNVYATAFFGDGSGLTGISGGGSNFNPAQFETNSAQVTLKSGALLTNTVVRGSLTVTNINNVKVYRALVSQSGTDTPTAIVLENSLGGTPVWTRTDPGVYELTLNGAFTDNKTFCMGTILSVPDGTMLSVQVTSQNTMTFISGTTGTPADGSMILAPITILVYP